MRYFLGFTKVGYRFAITDEVVQKEQSQLGQLRPAFYYRHEDGRAFLTSLSGNREIPKEEINPQLSILSQRKDPYHYPEITEVGSLFAGIRLYRDWEFGTLALVREPCDVSLQSNYLEEDGSNLGVVLDRLLARPLVKDQILASLATFYENTGDLRTTVEGGKVQTRLEEKGLNASIPLIRMSDGTVRWLALMAILLNPDPPPVVVIEEPELGLHPDMVHELGKLLVEASTRMQIIITTHSTQLIEEFTETPEVVIVCEKENGASTFERLNAQGLAAWIKEYSLGHLWTSGQLGGNRW